MTMGRTGSVALAVLLVASGAWAQEWRGEGRLMGRVVDEQGKAVEGVIVRASVPSMVGVLEARTDRRGDWAVNDVAEGSWKLNFEKDGYDPAEAISEVDESGRSSSVRTVLKRTFDPNAFIKEQVAKADALMAQRKFGEARTIYEAIVAKVPEVAGSMQQFIARTYYEDGKLDKAIEHLELSVAKAPENAQAKVMLTSVLLEAGATDRASQVLATVDPAAITEPGVYLNFGLALLKQQKAADALQRFDQAVTRFPQAPESYYYRANALIELVNAEKDPENPTRIERLGRIKADLQKFLQLAPNAPEAEQVRKLLEQIK